LNKIWEFGDWLSAGFAVVLETRRTASQKQLRSIHRRSRCHSDSLLWHFTVLEPCCPSTRFYSWSFLALSICKLFRLLFATPVTPPLSAPLQMLQLHYC